MLRGPRAKRPSLVRSDHRRHFAVARLDSRPDAENRGIHHQPTGHPVHRRQCFVARGRRDLHWSDRIIDDISPLRALTPDLMPKTAAFITSRPATQYIDANASWPEGEETFIGQIGSSTTFRRCAP